MTKQNNMHIFATDVLGSWDLWSHLKFLAIARRGRSPTSVCGEATANDQHTLFSQWRQSFTHGKVLLWGQAGIQGQLEH